MTAKFEAKGSSVTNTDTRKVVIFGKIIEGKITSGMSIIINHNKNTFTGYEIQNIDTSSPYLKEQGHIGLILKLDNNDIDLEIDFFDALNIGDEVCEVRN